VLAAIGIYGVVSHAVARRTGEVAVRLALGARPAEVVRLVARQHLAWVLWGVAAGLGGALTLTRLLESQLFGVRPTDPATYLVAAVALVGVALVADVAPASRAARVMPAEALRHE
jgi:putative ABC transport system permease protein